MVNQGRKNKGHHNQHPRHQHQQHHHKKPWKNLFWLGVKRYGFVSALKWEFSHPRRYPQYPIWLIPMLISMIALALILFFYPIGFLPILFYIFEIIVLFFVVFRILKRINRIRIHGNLMRLYGLYLLSGLVTFLGFIILFIPAFMGFSAMLLSPFSDQSATVGFLLFGSQWQCPYFISIIFYEFGFGFMIIGAYLLFKFKMKSGNVIWVGRM